MFFVVVVVAFVRFTSSSFFSSLFFACSFLRRQQVAKRKQNRVTLYLNIRINIGRFARQPPPDDNANSLHSVKNPERRNFRVCGTNYRFRLTVVAVGCW